VNSPRSATTRDYLTREIVPFVDREFRTLASASTAAAGGKYGRYGAILRHEVRENLGAVADHSGDAYFDFVYWHDWPTR